MTRDEALDIFLAKRDAYDQIASRDIASEIFNAGWAAYEESLKQGIMSFNAAVAQNDAQAFPDKIYAAWHPKKARGTAIPAIQKALKKVSGEYLLFAVEEYIAATQTWKPEDRQFVPLCASWMNAERWADDRSTWQRGGTAPVSQFSVTR